MSEQQSTTITVLGAGYVGLTTATLLAHAGYTVYAVEPNEARRTIIQSGKSFFYEEGLSPLIKSAIDANHLIVTDSYEDSIPHSSIVIGAVGTPDNPDGSMNLSYVFSAAQQAASLMNDNAIFVQKSTVPVGTGKKIQEVFAELQKNIFYVSNPEFLREGTSVHDTLYPDRVVTGSDKLTAANKVLDLYKNLAEHRDEIAKIAGIKPVKQKTDSQYIATKLASAELIKVTSNAFLALKISFANSIAKLADSVDADIVDVMDAVGADKRIGRAFLNAGRGYGGGCFPKDVSGLIASSLENGVDFDIMQSAQTVNQSMPGYIVEKLQNSVGSLAGKTVAVLGLAFKSNTSDVRKSPGVSIANILIASDATVRVYDPEAAEEATLDLHSRATIADSIDEAIADADAVIIATAWNDILSYPAESFAKNMTDPVLFDAVNSYDRVAAQQAGLTYLGVGRRAS